MALPVQPNTTCNIYRLGTSPPTDPAVSNVPCYLQPDWRGGAAGGMRQVNALTWTHVMLVDATIDIRDAYTGAATVSPQDTVFIPDDGGTQFNVVFVERLERGTPNEHKRVFLDRQTPSWPTNEV
jgi:hypothetical protein